MSRLIVALCALVTLARANYYVVHPIASTVYKAGKPLVSSHRSFYLLALTFGHTIVWEENGAEPLSNSFGQTRVSICTYVAFLSSHIID